MSDLQRAEAMSKIAAELVGYAEEIIECDDYREKIEFMTETFSEVILGLFKMHLILNPNVSSEELVADFAWELQQKLGDIFNDKPKRMMN